MAIYHMSVKIHGRSIGQSAVACAAYRSGSRLYDEELGKTYDYTKKKEVVFTQILLCKHAPAEYQDRGILWNSVMRVEKASNAQFAREFEMALPVEADRETQIKMIYDFFAPLVEEGMCIDIAIHDKGDGNPHCQALATMRPIKEDGRWGAKEKKGYLLDEAGNRIPVIDPETGTQKVDRKNRKQWKRGMVETTGWNRRDRVEGWRKDWERCCNRYLSEEKQIDHRSYARQGVLQLPTIHEGYEARKMETEGRVSQRCEENREIRSWNAFLKKIRRQLNEFAGEFMAIRMELMKMTLMARSLLIRGLYITKGRSGYGYDGTDRRIDGRNRFSASGAAGPPEGSGRADRGYLPDLPAADGTGAGGRSEDTPAAGTDPEMENIMQRSDRTKRSIDEAESGIAALKRAIDAGRRVRERYEQIQQERELAGYAPGRTAGGISREEAGNPCLIHTEDFIAGIVSQIKRRERDAARIMGGGRAEIRERERRL